MRWTAFALTALACSAAPAQAQLAPAGGVEMTFQRVDAPNLCRRCDVIRAVGAVASDTPAKFNAFLEHEQIRSRPIHVIVDSGGGKVGASWALGRKLRAIRASVIVAAVVERPDGSAEIRPGICASMCNSLLSAGVERRISPGSVFGVHQFSPTSETFRNLDNAVTVRDMRGQLKMVAEWLAYAREMKIDQRLVEAQLTVPYEKVDYISHDTLAAWRVVTASGATLPKLLRNARAGADASASQPTPVAATPQPSAPAARPPDRQWSPVRQNGDWRETTMESDADFLRVAIACSPQGRHWVQITLRGAPEARQKALAQQIIAGGGFELVDRPIDISQLSIGFGGVFWVRAALQPDQVARLAASQGHFRFALAPIKGDAQREMIQVRTTGFADAVEPMIASCAAKKPVEQAAAPQQR